MNRFFTILSIAAVALAACNKENEEPGQKIDPAQLVDMTFEVSAKPTQAAVVQNVSTKQKSRKTAPCSGLSATRSLYSMK